MGTENFYLYKERANPVVSIYGYWKLSLVFNLQKSQKLRETVEILQLELSVLRDERQSLLAQVQELETRQPIAVDDSEVCIYSH